MLRVHSVLWGIVRGSEHIHFIVLRKWSLFLNMCILLTTTSFFFEHHEKLIAPVGTIYDP